jgi:hypothetical protein
MSVFTLHFIPDESFDIADELFDIVSLNRVTLFMMSRLTWFLMTYLK